ncbi:hypothetical protein KCP70_19225 [Salmonella enterica subsp. enterica]|nr:hypothetical protein KCP70_19225 [Salmonella enterica subsp. enterica]
MSAGVINLSQGFPDFDGLVICWRADLSPAGADQYDGRRGAARCIANAQRMVIDPRWRPVICRHGGRDWAHAAITPRAGCLGRG